MRAKFTITENDPTWGSVCTITQNGNAIASITPAPGTSPESFRIVCGSLALASGSAIEISNEIPAKHD